MILLYSSCVLNWLRSFACHKFRENPYAVVQGKQIYQLGEQLFLLARLMSKAFDRPSFFRNPKRKARILKYDFLALSNDNFSRMCSAFSASSVFSVIE